MSFAYPINNRQDTVTTVLKFPKDSAVSGLCNTTILRKTWFGINNGLSFMENFLLCLGH